MKALLVLFLCFLAFAAIIILAWAFVQVGQQWTRYEKKVAYIRDFIKHKPVTPENYDYIYGELMELKRFRCRNIKTNQQLTLSFFFKYKDECKRRVNGDKLITKRSES